jgi:Cu(I)/Ag(I) efflux system membrane protein CusA/SilA
MLAHPVVLAWILSVTFLLGLAPLGNRPLFLATLFGSLLAVAVLARSRRSTMIGLASLLVIALTADMSIKPLEWEFMVPLDEGMIMDMPITVPRASITESVDDMKARNMVLCRFPEVEMVVGKAGRAETPTDPAPLDMIETMVNFRPRPFWPRRRLRRPDARRQAAAVLDAFAQHRSARFPSTPSERAALIEAAVDAALPRFDVVLREFASERNNLLVRRSGGLSPTSLKPSDPEEAKLVPVWVEHINALNGELLDRASVAFTRLIIEELLARAEAVDPAVAAELAARQRVRLQGIESLNAAAARGPSAGSTSAGHHHHGSAEPLILPPQPHLDPLENELAREFRSWLLLWTVERSELVGFGGELDRAVSMPGWTNVWTMPM